MSKREKPLSKKEQKEIENHQKMRLYMMRQQIKHIKSQSNEKEDKSTN